MFVRVNHNASLVCPRIPEGVSPQNPLVWWKDDVLVQTTTPQGSQGQSQRVWMRNSQLYISRALTDDSGEYACGIQGQRKPAGTVKLFVQDVPDPPGEYPYSSSINITNGLSFRLIFTLEYLSTPLESV